MLNKNILQSASISVTIYVLLIFIYSRKLFSEEGRLETRGPTHFYVLVHYSDGLHYIDHFQVIVVNVCCLSACAEAVWPAAVQYSIILHYKM